MRVSSSLVHKLWAIVSLLSVAGVVGQDGLVLSASPSFSPTIFDINATDAPSSSAVPSAAPSAVPSAAPSALTEPPVAPQTAPPSNVTDAPSMTPTANATLAPTNTTTTEAPTGAPTVMNVTVTMAPSAAPSGIPSDAPSTAPTFGMVEGTVEGLAMTLFGINGALNEAEVASWEAVTIAYQTLFYENAINSPIQDFEATLAITSMIVPGRRRGLRKLQEQGEEDFITILYTQTVQYRLIDEEAADLVDPISVSTAPFSVQEGRDAYLELLQQSGQGVLADITSTSGATTDSTLAPTSSPVEPTEAPTDAAEEDEEGPLSTGAIIGIAVGGGVLVLGLLFYLCCRGGDNEYTGANDPPPSVNVKDHGDEISTLAPPPLSGGLAASGSIAGYGDQSVATVDYDYSKAYGGAGDAVSSAGGTFGSQMGGQSVLDPRVAGATGAAALGSFSDGDSFSAAYREGASGNVKEEVMNIFAPPGKLGVVIDTPDDGAPVVHAVKDTSVIADKIVVGDKLVAVDDEDVRSMTAIKVSKLISRKSANPSRKLTIIRTSVIQ